MSYTKLRYHLVWATKCRRPWITRDSERELYEAMREAARQRGWIVVMANGAADHVHVLVDAPQMMTPPGEVMRCLKRASRRRMKELGMSGFAWQQGGGAFSVSAGFDAKLIEYIRRQKEHHGVNILMEEYERTE